MRPPFRSVPFAVCASIAAVALSVIGFLPLFGGPGYEAALAAGLVLPSLTAIAVALDPRHSARRPSQLFVLGIEMALAMGGIALLLTLLHGARAGFCDPSSGLALFALGPLPGTVLGAVWGLLVGQVTSLFVRRRRRRIATCIALSLLGPMAGAAISLWRFFSSPMVFAYDPFFGFFSGTIYDTVVTDSLTTLLTYRVGTLATIVAVGCLAFAFVRKENGRYRLNPERHPGVLWLGTVATVTSLIMTVEGDRLGHWQTSETIAEELGARIIDERCELVYPRAVDDATARLMLRDCATQSRQVMRYLGMQRAPQVRVFVFSNPEQKRALAGAAKTSVAKPWRKEVYIHLRGYPHPILGHELAHVLAGTLARGPFKVAGSYGGWLPNPGLIEGIAVAASPDDDVLTPQQWSAAMMKLDVLPPLETIFALGFLGESSSAAYTVAGAFVHWIREQHGIDAVQRWYGGATLPEVTSSTLGKLEVAWRKDLAKVEVADKSLAYAEARFDRPGVFRRRCPHAVDAFNHEGRRLAASGDCVGATNRFERAAELDPLHPGSRLSLARCAVPVEGIDGARQRWRDIHADGMLPETTRLRAKEGLADLHLSARRSEKAETLYVELLDRVVDEDRLRTIDVKLRAARNPYEGRAVRALLLGEPGRPPDHRLAFSLLGKWMTEVPGDGLPAYLVGRNLMHSGSWHAAGEFLDWALERKLPQERVMLEALRVRIIVACAQRDEATARRLMARWKAQPGLQEVRWRVLERRLGACVMP